MSIIHDALKKVQQGLNPKIDTTPAAQSGTTVKGASYIFETPAAVEEKPSVKKNIQSTLASTCILLVTIVIIIASIQYIYQQCQTDIPKVQNLAQQSFYTLVHNKALHPFKAKPAAELQPLAQLTLPANGTLNIHGIMANGARNLALINDQVYQEGDEVDGAKIIKIDLNSITVDVNGAEKTIFVKS